MKITVIVTDKFIKNYCIEHLPERRRKIRLFDCADRKGGLIGWI